jgi:hypothetical protein
MAWLPYLTKLANDIYCLRPFGLNTTLVALNINKETIREAEQVGRVENLFQSGEEIFIR